MTDRPKRLPVSAFMVQKCLCWKAAFFDTFCSIDLLKMATIAGKTVAETERKKQGHYQDVSGTYKKESVSIKF